MIYGSNIITPHLIFAQMQSAQQQQNYVKVSQFRYPDKSQRPQLIYPMMPLSTVREKIFSMGQLDQDLEKSSTLLLQDGQRFGPDGLKRSTKLKDLKESMKRQVRSVSYRRFITPRDKAYRPELLIFARYNYENYTNYAYKNPFRPKAPNIISSQQKPRQKQPFTYQANLQTIYYKSKYDDFNKIVSQKLIQSRSESVLRKDKANTSATKKKKSKVQQKQQDDEYRRVSRVKIGNSSLANLIKQFTVLQKLTQMIETEMFNVQQPLSVNVFSPVQESIAQQIFLQVLIHRFKWLRVLNKRLMERLFTALGVEVLDKYTKISLKIYVDFVKLFIVRDAADNVLSQFLFKFFFSKKQIVTKQIFDQTLDSLDGPESKHKKILDAYAQFFQDPVKHYGFRTFSEKNANIMNMIIDLFVLV